MVCLRATEAHRAVLGADHGVCSRMLYLPSSAHWANSVLVRGVPAKGYDVVNSDGGRAVASR